MKREIKFRAWNKSTLEMNIYVEIYCYKDGSTGFSASNENNNPIGNTENFELLQSTGLKDVNGTEIFEGDFIQFMHHLHKIFRVNGGLVINSHPGDFYKYYTPFYEACADMQTSQWIEQCKIIGNVYQNAELLIKPK